MKLLTEQEARDLIYDEAKRLAAKTGGKMSVAALSDHWGFKARGNLDKQARGDLPLSPRTLEKLGLLRREDAVYFSKDDAIEAYAARAAARHREHLARRAENQTIQAKVGSGQMIDIKGVSMVLRTKRSFLESVVGKAVSEGRFPRPDKTTDKGVLLWWPSTIYDWLLKMPKVKMLGPMICNWIFEWAMEHMDVLAWL